MITIAAVDDDRMLLTGLRAWLAPVEGVDLIATAATVPEFLALHTTVDVVLLDLNLRDGSSPAANVRALLGRDVAVLVVSTIPDAEHVLATIEAGAAGYVTKDNDLPALVDAIRDVAAGGAAVSPELAFVLSTDRRPERPRLSAQETLVLRTYASGATLQATARRAGIAYGTAREYLERIKRKYTDTGRPTRTKLDLVDRVREDRLELHGLDNPPD
ncbi:MAG TPA: response regulator transcription factor [Pseudonocardiaceae bacterium]|jgi:two-component system nitrate/nitrite response regulator NarL|nr:response regulator transcription factor [Pseudonocardiaceae bacterium]